MADIHDIHECPDCGSDDIIHVDSKEQIICRTCGLVYEPTDKPLGDILSNEPTTKLKFEEGLKEVVKPVKVAKPVNKVIKKKVVKKKIVKKKPVKKVAKKPIKNITKKKVVKKPIKKVTKKKVVKKPVKKAVKKPAKVLVKKKLVKKKIVKKTVKKPVKKKSLIKRILKKK